ncbi:MAG: hypothetical protein K0R61_155 [Microvirga sp.]|nr:hypothetical protein [Microvirga sp.]
MPDDDLAIEAAFDALLATLAEDGELLAHHAEWDITAMDGDFHLLAALRAAITAYERARREAAP